LVLQIVIERLEKPIIEMMKAHPYSGGSVEHRTGREESRCVAQTAEQIPECLDRSGNGRSDEGCQTMPMRTNSRKDRGDAYCSA
jgi:hypothetical protein